MSDQTLAQVEEEIVRVEARLYRQVNARSRVTAMQASKTASQLHTLKTRAANLRAAQ